MNFVVKEFERLSARELYEIYKLRCKVFVVEQNCPYQDVDDKDLGALHVMMLQDNKLTGYARILPPGLSYDEPSIGRVVVEKNERRKKAGAALMKYTMNKTLELFNNQDIVISAQFYLKEFYSQLGFKTEGGEYLEDEIRHIKMKYKIQNL